MAKVSVIIPVYGVERYIERCAISLFEQTLDDIEFIFVDDCTPDKSINILGHIIERYRLRFAEKNYVVRIERMLTNSGLPAVREHGTKLATGDYIIHCDSDDWVDVDIVRTMYEEAILKNADIVICDYFASDGKTHKVKHFFYSEHKEQLIKDLLYQRASWALWNKLVRRNLYKEIVFPKYNMGEDMATTIQLIMRSQKIVSITQPLYYYYYNPLSITNEQSVESRIHKFMQVCENTKLVESVIGYDKAYTDGLLYVKVINRNLLIGSIHVSEVRELWEKKYPGLTWKLMISRGADFRQKIRSLYYEFVRIYDNLLSIYRNTCRL